MKSAERCSTFYFFILSHPSPPHHHEQFPFVHHDAYFLFSVCEQLLCQKSRSNRKLYRNIDVPVERRTYSVGVLTRMSFLLLPVVLSMTGKKRVKCNNAITVLILFHPVENNNRIIQFSKNYIFKLQPF